MHFYSIHVIAEYNLSGSEIICRQIYTRAHSIEYQTALIQVTLTYEALHEMKDDFQVQDIWRIDYR